MQIKLKNYIFNYNNKVKILKGRVSRPLVSIVNSGSNYNGNNNNNYNNNGDSEIERHKRPVTSSWILFAANSTV